MKKIIYIFSILISIFSCASDSDDNISQITTTFNFTHSWDNTNVSNANFNTIQFKNENEENLSITKLRYLISKITFIKSSGEELVLDGYNLIDVTNNSKLTYSPVNTIPTGTYANVKFTFGFNNDDNYNNNYQDLNSASWNVPGILGGGYHFMQLEGKFIDNTATETGYAYHAIRAVDNSGATQVFQDTFFEVNLGEVEITNNATFNINMNIAEWFKSPNTWDLNALNNMLMPNFNAQVLIFENGQNVFSLESVSQ
ncbi:MbnP family protein [Algibacter aquimarinus]|uniref:Copper-binding protein MbnP-like domain-containing protein n=1 Tax=Algibacter aquimarinus TaxID=1136748 RepID=A0ABP9HJI2_9FLAO